MNPLKLLMHILKVVIYLAVAFLGTMLVLSYFETPFAIQVKFTALSFLTLMFSTNGMLVVFVGIILILPFLFAIVNFFIPEINSNRFLSIEDASGYIHISIRAISEYIKQVAKQYADINDASPRLYYKKGRLEMLIYLEVSSKQSIPGLAEILKADIKDKLVRITSMPLESIGKIEIVIDEIDVVKEVKYQSKGREVSSTKVR